MSKCYGLQTREIILSDEDVMTLATANRLLWLLCDDHAVVCHCRMCDARILTDVQDMLSDGPEATLARKIIYATSDVPEC